MTYTPQPGTIPAKVIAALQQLPPDTELPTCQVIELIGQPEGWKGLVACLTKAVDERALNKRLCPDTNNLFWSLGPDAPRMDAHTPGGAILSALDAAMGAPSFDCAYSITGSLIIRKGHRAICLEPSETVAMLEHVERSGAKNRAGRAAA